MTRSKKWIVPTLYILFLMLPIYGLLSMSFKTTNEILGGSTKVVTEPVTEPMRIWHLLTHTAGLTYGFHYVHPVDALYRSAGFEFGPPRDVTLAEAVEKWASMPLVFQPGTEWNYGVSTDVLGRVVEVVSGLDEGQDVVKAGVAKSHIIDGRAEHATLLEIFTNEGVGTEIV